MPRHLQKRRRLWYSVLDIPKDARHAFNGKPRFVKSLQTEHLSVAEGRVGAVVGGWKRQIEAARRSAGVLLDPLEEDIRWWREHLSALSGDDRATAEIILTDKAEALEAEHTGSGVSFAKRAFGQVVSTGDHIDEWIKTLTTSNTPKTRDIKRTDARRLARRFPALAGVTKKEVQRWVNDLSQGDRPQKPNSIRRILSHCRSYWSHLQSLDLVSANLKEPFNALQQRRSRGKAASIDDRLAFKPAEVVRLLREAQVRAKEKAPGTTAHSLPLLIQMGMWTGCRIEELCSLRCEKVHFDGCEAFFEIEDSKTKAGRRVVPIHSKLRETLQEAVRSRGDGYVIPSLAVDQYGDRSNAIGKSFGALKRGMGFGPELVFHSLRKTFITRLQQARVPEDIAAALVGHEIKTMTYGVYAVGGVTLQDMQEAIERIDYPR